jgi:hypothetical protein
MYAMFTKADLAQFYGSEQFYRHWTGELVYTDGVHYLTQHGAAWLVDSIASHQLNPKLRQGMLADFQFWELHVKDGKGVLTCKADDGMAPAVRQEIEYTDFPLPEIKLYLEAGHDGSRPVMVLMLPRER